jgi:hypothetical protein
MASEAQIAELLEKMAAERARLVAQVQALSEEEASRAPVGKTGEEEWTVKEQLAHLAEMELSYVAWVRAALAQENPDVSGMEPPRPAIPIERANEHTVAELIEQMAREREETLALIRSLEPAQFDRTATHRMFGTLTVLQWLRSFYRHDRMHSDQIAGREPEYKPRFTGPEPNQRRMRLEQVARGQSNAAPEQRP